MNKITSKFSVVDSTLYSVGILLGVTVVFFNNIPAPQNQTMLLDSYMEKVITRIDNVSGQLSRWESLDIGQTGK